jgi:chromosome segregation ATPase
MAEQWLSYQQIGEALSISSAAARHKTARYRFARRLRNDGRAEVLVDIEDLQARMPLSRRSAPTPSRAEPPLDTRSIAELQARIAELEQHLLSARSAADQARTDADRERAERLDERARADRLAGEVAELARKLAALVERVAPPDRPQPAASVLTVQRRRRWWPWRRAG